MSDLFDNLPTGQPLQRIWQGTIAEDIVDFGDRASIIVPSFTSEIQITGCRWQSRDDLNKPNRGDACLAALDDNNEWWVIAWWPFQT